MTLKYKTHINPLNQSKRRWFHAQKDLSSWKKPAPFPPRLNFLFLVSDFPISQIFVRFYSDSERKLTPREHLGFSCSCNQPFQSQCVVRTSCSAPVNFFLCPSVWFTVLWRTREKCLFQAVFWITHQVYFWFVPTGHIVQTQLIAGCDAGGFGLFNCFAIFLFFFRIYIYTLQIKYLKMMTYLDSQQNLHTQNSSSKILSHWVLTSSETTKTKKEINTWLLFFGAVFFSLKTILFSFRHDIYERHCWFAIIFGRLVTLLALPVSSKAPVSESKSNRQSSKMRNQTRPLPRGVSGTCNAQSLNAEFEFRV